MTWEIVLGIIALCGAAVTLGGVAVKLATTISRPLIQRLSRWTKQSGRSKRATRGNTAKYTTSSTTMRGV